MLKGMSPYIRAKFINVTKKSNLAPECDVAM